MTDEEYFELHGETREQALRDRQETDTPHRGTSNSGRPD